jgi:chaperonin GroES
MKPRMIGKRTLVKPAEQEEEKTICGIVLPQTAKGKPQTARVITISDSEDGRVGEGELVVFAKYSGTEIRLSNEDYLILDSDTSLGSLKSSV